MKKLSTILFIFASYQIFSVTALPLNIHFKAPEFSLSGLEIKLQENETLVQAIKRKYKKSESRSVKKLAALKKINSDDSTSKDNFKNDENINEILKNIQIEKSKAVSNTKPDYDQDGLVMYDYSKTKEESIKTKSLEIKRPENQVVDSIQTVASAPISSPLMAVMEREMVGVNNVSSSKKNILEPLAQSNSFTKSTSSTSNLVIKAMEVTLEGDNILEDLSNFQLQTPFHEDQVMSSDLNGHIGIDMSEGVFRGTLLYNNAVSTRVELPVDREGGLFRVPLLTYDSVRKYMDENKLEGHGGHYLVEVGDNVADVDIELSSSNTPYELRVLFDGGFNEVKQGDDFRYILFFGINPGNVTVKSIGYNGEFADKISLITPDEVLFDYLEIKKENTKKFNLVMNNTMSIVPSGINVDSSKIKTIIGSGKSKKVSENTYQYTSYPKILGMKEYLELDYLNDKVYFSLKNESDINIPSNEFIAEVFNQFEIEALEERCLIQVNMNSELLGVNYALESDSGHESVDILFLDKDGIFTDEVSPLTKKMFVVGHRQGVINLKLKDVKGDTSYQRTFCSTATYLVEHF